MTRRKKSLVSVSWTWSHACCMTFEAINHLANLKPAVLPEYTHRSSERKPTSAPPRCCWGQFHLRCCCCTSGTRPSCTSQWWTIGWQNSSRLRKLLGTYEEAANGDLHHWTVSSKKDDLTLVWRSLSAQALAFLWNAKIEGFSHLPFFQEMSQLLYEYYTQRSLPCALIFLVN